MKRYEFSYRDNNHDMHFVVVYDNSLRSAIERVLGRGVELSTELKQSSGTGNYFISGWENTNFAIHEQPYEPSAHVIMPHKSKIDSVLEGLI